MEDRELNELGEQMILSTSLEESIRTKIEEQIREFGRLNGHDLDDEAVRALTARLMSGGFNALNAPRD